MHVVVAALIGGTAGFFGGKLDLAVQRIIDAWMSFPGLLLLLTIMSHSRAGTGADHHRVGGVRRHYQFAGGEKCRHRDQGENDYFAAAQATGSQTPRTLMRHVLPNVAAPMIIIYSITIGGIIVSEASLSFLGFGLPHDVPSWGGMLSREGRQHMEIAPRLALWPGLCLTIVVYSVNMFGDALRDLLDPRLRGGDGGLGSPGARFGQESHQRGRTERHALNGEGAGTLRRTENARLRLAGRGVAQSSDNERACARRLRRHHAGAGRNSQPRRASTSSRFEASANHAP